MHAHLSLILFCSAGAEAASPDDVFTNPLAAARKAAPPPLATVAGGGAAAGQRPATPGRRPATAEVMRAHN